MPIKIWEIVENKEFKLIGLEDNPSDDMYLLLIIKDNEDLDNSEIELYKQVKDEDDINCQ